MEGLRIVGLRQSHGDPRGIVTPTFVLKFLHVPEQVPVSWSHLPDPEWSLHRRSPLGTGCPKTVRLLFRSLSHPECMSNNLLYSN